MENPGIAQEEKHYQKTKRLGGIFNAKIKAVS
jgi:hypothetical protein